MPEVFVDLARGALGFVAIFLFLYFFSSERRNIDWRLVGSGFVLQVLIAVLVIKVPLFNRIIGNVSGLFLKLLEFSLEGSTFLFGELPTDPSYGAFFAFRVLPSIAFFSALASLFYYLGILQKVIFVFAWVMQKTMRLSGAESVAAAANIFIGQTEAPLIVRPYLERMTKSEIVCLMTGGMATIAGAVLIAYMNILGGEDEIRKIEVGKHLISASIIAAPGAIICAKMLFPESEKVETDLRVGKESIGVNLFDAVANGTTQGLKLAVNVGAIVLVFLALMALLNYIATDWIGSWSGINEMISDSTGGIYESLTLQFIFGVLFSPVAFLMGVDGGNLLVVGQLLGQKMVMNEFVAFQEMRVLIDAGHLTNEKSFIISTFALCGFANFSSMGIQIGGISVLAPGQRENLARMAFRAMIGGTCASLMTATLAGILS
ncbi:MAG: Putative nucleoside permease NupX [Candidatus Moanabacter tarae]|uniref:Nucleoside permease NupX n=1 Tax=Candidatus Moanibacter tarae TaxID=2200854 RepID=A0A2Z4AFU4_9BACT|nr:MAG: Putative nucleoside permease NupX [Candidatus Moanabacter tarae]|tara:strand:+ start:7450 stop:8748 length:1299 start_codon:yes stop_codon:yes gene_type:complete